MTKDSPVVSILVTTWNTSAEIAACLDSIPAGIGPDISFEVVIVDNGSRDGTQELLPERCAELKATAPNCVATDLVLNPANRGFAAGMNQAYGKSTGQFVLLLNSDIVFTPASLKAMVDRLRNAPEITGVSPLYLNPDGTFQQHYVQFPSLLACVALLTAFKKVPPFSSELNKFTMTGADFSRPRQLASGSCMLLRREHLPAGPVFDEHFPIYWNDAVLARQLFEAGRQLWMFPDIAVVHARGSACRLLGTGIRYQHLVGSMITYLRLWIPEYQVAALSLAVKFDWLVKRAVGKPVELGWSDLRAALNGECGPLPDGDVREWGVILADGQGDSATLGPILEAQRDLNRRVLIVSAVGRRRLLKSRIERVDEEVWIADPPTPFRGRSGGWLAERFVATRVRRWLDKFAGPRSVIDVSGSRPKLADRVGQDAARYSAQSTSTADSDEVEVIDVRVPASRPLAGKQC